MPSGSRLALVDQTTDAVLAIDGDRGAAARSACCDTPMSHTLQSALDPAGRQAALIYHLWLTMFWVTAAVFTVVVGAIAVAVIIGRRRRRADAASHPSEFALSTAVFAAVAAT